MPCKIVVFLLITDIMVGLVLSANLPWITAMKVCAYNSLAPFDPGENDEPDKKWTGTVKYHMSIGIVTLQIEKSEDDREKYCSAFIVPLLNAIIWRNGTYCLSPLSELLEGTNGYKCTLADFNLMSIEDLPTPTHCMMHQENSSRYVSCKKKIDDGCQPINKGNNSQLRITLSFTYATNQYCKDEPCKAINPEKCCLILLIKQYKFYLIVFVSLVGILNVACICCQNDTNEVVTNNTQRTEARMRIVQQNKQNNDMEASRNAKSQSGDYNLAWPGGGWSTTVASTDMNTVPVEEIYSKQKIVWEDGMDATTEPSLDDQTNPEYSIKTGNNHKMVTNGGIKCVEITNSNTLAEALHSTVVIVDQKQHIDKASYNKPDDNLYSKVNIIGTKQEIKEEEAQGKSEKPLQSIKSDDTSSYLKKPTEANVKALDKLTKIKKTHDKTPPIASIGSTKDVRFKIDNSNTTGEKNAVVRLETKL